MGRKHVLIYRCVVCMIALALPVVCTAARQRGGKQNARDSAGDLPPGVRLVPDIAYREGNPKWRLDLALPSGSSDLPRAALVFVHGGGWRSGNKSLGQWRSMPVEYAARGYVCISVDYRLTDEAPFPACVEDVKCAVRWLRAHAGEYGVDPNRIGAYGNSAGAHLVAMLGLAGPKAGLEGDGPYQDQSSLVQAVCCSATPTDFTDWDGGAFRGESTFLAGPSETLAERRKKASPITYVRPDAPPFLVVHGTADRTVPFSQGQKFVEALKGAGARDVTFMEFEGAGHGVFDQHANKTGPALEAFFARVLKQSKTAAPTGAARAVPAAGLLYYAKADYAFAESAAVVTNPHICGALFQVVWSEVEREDGQYDWSQVDGWIEPWSKAGKGVALRILWSTSGYWPKPYYKTPTPRWVWDQGAVFAFHEPSRTEIPLIWDPIYKKFAWRFLEQLAARYSGHPGLMFLDVTPGAETNPYRFGTINQRDPGFKDQFKALRASDGRSYSEDLWLDTVKEWVDASERIIESTPLLVTLNVGGLEGPDRLVTMGDYCVGKGFYVGQNGLTGRSYLDPQTGRSAAFHRWSQQTKLFFETVAASGGRTGTLLEVMQAAQRIGCSYLNVYPQDVLKGTPGRPDFDPAYEQALAYGARSLAGVP